MTIRSSKGNTLIGYDINSAFISDLINQSPSPFSFSALDSDIRVGFEVEFYLNESCPDLSLDRLLKCGLNVFASKIMVLPMSVNTAKEPDVWYLERDGSLEDSPFGFELVSPILKLSELHFYYQSVLDIIKDVGATTDSCGVHFHISSKTLGEIDAKKMLSLSSISNPISKWASRSMYARDIISLFSNSDTDAFMKYLPDISRNYSINFISEKHLELRCFGGAGYENDFNDTITALSSFVDIYVNSCTPGSCDKIVSAFLEAKSNGQCSAPITVEDVVELATNLKSKMLYLDDESAIEMSMCLFEEQNKLVPREILYGKL